MYIFVQNFLLLAISHANAEESKYEIFDHFHPCRCVSQPMFKLSIDINRLLISAEDTLVAIFNLMKNHLTVKILP